MKSNGLFLAGLLLAASFAAGQSTPQASGSQATQGTQASPSNATSPQNTTPDPASSSNSMTMPAQSDNSALQSRINDALRNEPTLGASHVSANVSDTAIDLSGTVGSTKDKQTAERIAESFDGNRKLTDNIVVTGAGHSDLAPNHPAMNNGGVGNAPNPAMNPNNPQKQ